MKKFYLLISLATLIGFSSCASLRIDKRQHAKGWYVDFGTEKKSATTTVADQEEEVAPSQDTRVPSVLLNNAGEVLEEKPAVPMAEKPAVIATSEEPAAPATNADGAATTSTSQNENINHESGPSEVSPGSDDQVLLIILAIFIPPLAVYLVQGVTAIFWITLICWLFGGVFLFGRFGYGYLGGLGLLAIVLALLVVFGKL